MTQSRPVSATGRRYGLAVFIGRFSPPHLGHLAVIKQALSVAESTLIIIGSANAARRFDFVPFTSVERETMIRVMLSAEENVRVRFAHVEDQGNMPAWSALVRKAANDLEPDNRKITLIGHAKDNSSYYLKHFPGWDATDVDNYLGLSATDIREEIFDIARDGRKPLAGVHDEVAIWLAGFASTDEFRYLVEEREKCRADLENYGRIDPATGKKVYGPYITADSIIVQGDHVLMIERGGYPFKGCVAFPGGFIEHDEDVVEAAIRETIEETRLKVSEATLRRSLVRTETFAAPFRDPRGRVVTFASFFYLVPNANAAKAMELPVVKGSDDAKRAFWMPISEVRRETTAFDHYSILQRMLENLPRGQ